ncbi:MAG: orotate phosphoribosyltransferase [Spirochaetaceae bacterium]|nr:orotate phosphoribosyltransferase [Spirochaetaceae bacterium]
MAKKNKLIDALLKLNLFYYSGKTCFIDSETKAPFFFDINSINSFPFYKPLFLDSLVSLIKKISGYKGKKNKELLLAAVGHSGIPFTALAANKLSLPMIYIRDSSKKHGKKNMIEGSVKEGITTILFTETLSSKAKIENGVKALNEKKSNIKAIITIFDMLDVSEIKTDEDIIPVYSLISLASFIEYAEKNKIINKKIIEAMAKWSKNCSGSLSPAPCSDASVAAEDASQTSLHKSGAGKTTCVSSKESCEASDNAQKAAKTLLDIKAITLSLKEPFRYASGILSPIYCDNRLLVSNPKKWNIIIDIMEQIIKTEIGIQNIEVIAGTSTAGIPHAALLAERFSLPMIYVKSEKGEIQKKSNIEGSLFYGKKVLVIEDLVSTGKSSIESVKILREHGAIVDYCVAIFTYQMESAEKTFAEEKCSLITASNFKTLIKTAVAKKYITDEEAEKAVNWNSDPTDWGKKYGYE